MLNDLIEMLEGIREAHGGDIRVLIGFSADAEYYELKPEELYIQHGPEGEDDELRATVSIRDGEEALVIPA